MELGVELELEEQDRSERREDGLDWTGLEGWSETVT